MAGIGGNRADLQFLTVAHFQHRIERCVMKAEMNRVDTGRQMLYHSSIPRRSTRRQPPALLLMSLDACQ